MKLKASENSEGRCDFPQTEGSPSNVARED